MATVFAQAPGIGRRDPRRHAIISLLPPPERDAKLMALHHQGVEWAFEDLSMIYRPKLLSFVKHSIGDRERAEDLVQETFLRVFVHSRKFIPEKKFSTWIFTIASNLAKNEMRNRSRRPIVLFSTIRSGWEADHRPLEWEDNTHRPDDLLRKRRLKELVDSIVASLPAHHREVFRLREMDGRSYEEISEITGVNLGTVKSRLHRARVSFAKKISARLN